MAKNKRHVDTPWLRGIADLCAYLGDIDERVCRKYFLSKGLEPAIIMGDDNKLLYFAKSEVDAFLQRNNKKQSVKL